MTYKCSSICTSLYLSRHKVSKLLIASLACENSTFEVVIVDRHCPDAKYGGGAFGQKLLSVKANGSVTNCMYRQECGLMVTLFHGVIKNYD
jgi:hypothetical protein